ncbi:MAG: hypothetical protein GW761_16885 [Leptospira sp.]|nr:hypothetical protein [Leptospira sp.]
MNKRNIEFGSTHHIKTYCLLILMVLLISYCNKTTLSLTKDKIETASYESKTESYLLGYYELGQTEEWVCPSGSHNKVVIERNKFDTIIHFAVGGVFTTRSNTIYCSKSVEVADIELDTKPKNQPKRK